MKKTATTNGAATASEDHCRGLAEAVAEALAEALAFAHLTKNGKITMVSDAISSN